MALNTSRQAVMEMRRTHVARLRTRGLTQREIVAALAQPEEVGGLRNEKGKPWSLATVNRDIRHAIESWRAEYVQERQEHASRMLAELREIRREGWRQGDMKVVLQACAQECKLLGLDEPDKLMVSDWRREAEAAGVDADSFYDELKRTAFDLVGGSRAS